ncbi:MAG TPA: hypothetical protein VFU31_19075 [Candidatus Binatia bacterium]|nr:hypothetical protein [Candidatus Binatia bacterium]
MSFRFLKIDRVGRAYHDYGPGNDSVYVDFV